MQHILGGVIAGERNHGGGAGATFLQATNVASATSLAFPSAVSVGSLLVVEGLTNGGTTTITDTLGNTYTLLMTRLAGNGLTSFFAYAFSGSAGACTVHSTQPAYFIIAEYSGVPNAAPASFNSDGGTGGTLDCGGLTTTSGNALILLCGHVWNISTTFTPSAGFTKRSDSGAVAIADSLTNSPGSITPQWTVTSAQQWNGVGVVFNT